MTPERRCSRYCNTLFCVSCVSCVLCLLCLLCVSSVLIVSFPSPALSHSCLVTVTPCSVSPVSPVFCVSYVSSVPPLCLLRLDCFIPFTCPQPLLSCYCNSMFCVSCVSCVPCLLCLLCVFSVLIG